MRVGTVPIEHEMCPSSDATNTTLPGACAYVALARWRVPRLPKSTLRWCSPSPRYRPAMAVVRRQEDEAKRDERQLTVEQDCAVNAVSAPVLRRCDWFPSRTRARSSWPNAGPPLVSAAAVRAVSSSDVWRASRKTTGQANQRTDRRVEHHPVRHCVRNMRRLSPLTIMMPPRPCAAILPRSTDAVEVIRHIVGAQARDAPSLERAPDRSRREHKVLAAREQRRAHSQSGACGRCEWTNSRVATP